MRYYEDIEPYGENDPDPALEHLEMKARRRISRMRQRNHERRRMKELTDHYSYKPSIWAAVEWDPVLKEYVENGRVGRAKHSHQQKWMKGYSNRIVRKLPPYKVQRKGKHYRKWFDYWWIWI